MASSADRDDRRPGRWVPAARVLLGLEVAGTSTLDGGGALMKRPSTRRHWCMAVRSGGACVRGGGDPGARDRRSRTPRRRFSSSPARVVTTKRTTSLFPGYRLPDRGHRSEGTASSKGTTSSGTPAYRQRAARRRSRPAVPLEKVAVPVVSDARAHPARVRGFIRAIREDTIPATDGREGRRSVEWSRHIYAAARKHRRDRAAGALTGRTDEPIPASRIAGCCWPGSRWWSGYRYAAFGHLAAHNLPQATHRGSSPRAIRLLARRRVLPGHRSSDDGAGESVWASSASAPPGARSPAATSRAGTGTFS